jgi:lysine 6-dehydrogenase
VLLGQAVRTVDQVEELISYGAGIPEPEAADNPLRYKVSWTFEGVLRSYLRAGRVIRDGQVVEIEASDIFSPEQIHHVEIEGLGPLEAFPNGDALK